MQREALQTVRALAGAQGLTVGEAVRRAIGHEQWLVTEKQAGSRIVAENHQDQDRRELVH